MALLRVASGWLLEVRRAETVGRGSCSRNCGRGGGEEVSREVSREEERGTTRERRNEQLLVPGRCSVVTPTVS